MGGQELSESRFSRSKSREARVTSQITQSNSMDERQESGASRDSGDNSHITGCSQQIGPRDPHTSTPAPAVNPATLYTTDAKVLSSQLSADAAPFDPAPG